MTTIGDLVASGRSGRASLTRADLVALYAEHRRGLVRLAVPLVDDRALGRSPAAGSVHSLRPRPSCRAR